MILICEGWNKMSSYDPTHTTLIRVAFLREMREIYALLKADMDEILLASEGFSFNVDWKFWKGFSPAEKIKQASAWLEEKVKERFFRKEKMDEAWFQKHVYKAYDKGVFNAEVSLTKAGRMKSAVRRAFAKLFPSVRKASETKAVLVEKAKEDLSAHAASVLKELKSIVSEQVIREASPTDLSNLLKSKLQVAFTKQATLFVESTVIRAHAEGQLDLFEEWGETSVFVEAEFVFTTMQDDRVCPNCRKLEGQQFGIEEARWLIPMHPRCRCRWRVSKKKS